MTSEPQLHLASSSPRRQEILTALGLEFKVYPVDVDERRLPEENPEDMVLRLATAKAQAARVDDGGAVVLGADTAVVAGTDILGKPGNADEALQTLARLSGRTHRVLTGVSVIGPGGVATALSETAVTFRAIAADEARAYWQSGEPRDKAGAYAIQGLGGAFVSRIEGSYTGVVGLPVFETLCLLRDAGIDIFPRQVRHDR